jgi:peptidoglycan/LPS O-acetylase OafA/YrhL
MQIQFLLIYSLPMMVELGKKFYRYDITGLRAIAVIFVILFHLFPGFFPHGYLGVDIFFVISGYVVTLYIRNSIINETFSLQDFYRRRILRLFPVFFLILSYAILYYFEYLGENFYKKLTDVEPNFCLSMRLASIGLKCKNPMKDVGN